MKISNEHEYLLQSVKSWFNQPDQINHYTNEVTEGVTAAEQYLLNRCPNHGILLDVGCGAGRISMYMAEQGYEVTGIDVSQGVLAVAQEQSKRRGLDIGFFQTNGLELPFHDDQYDIVVGFKVLGYIPTRKLRHDFLREVHRVLKPGGYCLLTQNIVPDEYIDQARDEHFVSSPASQFSIIEQGDTFPLGKGYVRWFTESELLDEISGSNFLIEDFISDEDFEGAGYMRLITLRNKLKWNR